jgi:hypothetical protein
MSGAFSVLVQYTILPDGREHLMRSIKLGQTGLDVSLIALGCESYGKPRPDAPTY